MRIHWAVVIFAVIGTILLTWHFRTHHLDFMIPKGVVPAPEDDGSDLALRTTLPQPSIEINLANNGILGNPEAQEASIMAEITDLDLGDLNSSPGLDSYLKFGEDNTPARLFELSSTLRTRGQFQRALLALERIIDTTPSDADALDEAAKGITNLVPTLPSWNVDPTSEISLMLHFSSARPASEEMKEAVLQLATLIRQASSAQLEIIPKIISTRRQEAPEDSPIALWISTTGQKPFSSAVITTKTSQDVDVLVDELSLAVFQTIHAHLAKIGYPTPPALEASGRDLLMAYTTRLMWRDFARVLYKEQAAALEKEDSN